MNKNWLRLTVQKQMSLILWPFEQLLYFAYKSYNISFRKKVSNKCWIIGIISSHKNLLIREVPGVHKGLQQGLM